MKEYAIYFQDILYKLRSQLKVEDVTNIGGGSIFSKLQPLGIVVLEEQLIIQDPAADKRAAKKGRFETPVSDDISHWIELSRLMRYFFILDYHHIFFIIIIISFAFFNIRNIS